MTVLCFWKKEKSGTHIEKNMGEKYLFWRSNFKSLRFTSMRLSIESNPGANHGLKKLVKERIKNLY